MSVKKFDITELDDIGDPFDAGDAIIEAAAHGMAMDQFQPDLKARIIGKMRAEAAIDLSDGEIERCMGRTVMPTKMTRLAYLYRDCGYMTVADLRRDSAE